MKKIHRRILAALVVAAMLLPGCATISAKQVEMQPATSSSHLFLSDHESDMANSFCRPRPGNNTCVSWNS